VWFCYSSNPVCNAHAQYYIVKCSLSDSTILFHIISQTVRFWENNLRKKNIYRFLFSLQLLSETFLMLRRIHRDMIIDVYRSSCKLPVVLSDFKWVWIFSTFSKNTQIQNLMKIRTMGAEFFHADGWVERQTDRNMKILVVSFRNFANAPKRTANVRISKSADISNLHKTARCVRRVSKTGIGKNICCHRTINARSRNCTECLHDSPSVTSPCFRSS
jgi:hypothetical protein